MVVSVSLMCRLGISDVRWSGDLGGWVVCEAGKEVLFVHCGKGVYLGYK